VAVVPTNGLLMQYIRLWKWKCFNNEKKKAKLNKNGKTKKFMGRNFLRDNFFFFVLFVITSKLKNKSKKVQQSPGEREFGN